MTSTLFQTYSQTKRNYHGIEIESECKPVNIPCKTETSASRETHVREIEFWKDFFQNEYKTRMKSIKTKDIESVLLSLAARGVTSSISERSHIQTFVFCF